MSVIETLTFRLGGGADEDEFLAADRRFQTEFVYHQPGLVRRTTARGSDGEWIVVVLWQSAADADKAAEASSDDPRAAAFRVLLDDATVQSRRYITLD